jgi:hypothetical protein
LFSVASHRNAHGAPQFAIVDGQDRTTAAILRGQEKVPCQVVQADRTKQAAAYAAVNGNITKTNAQQLYHAKLAATDVHALALADVCAAAGVEILRKNLIQSDIKKRQTHAVTALSRCLTLCGRDTRKLNRTMLGLSLAGRLHGLEHVQRPSTDQFVSCCGLMNQSTMVHKRLPLPAIHPPQRLQKDCTWQTSIDRLPKSSAFANNRSRRR